MATMPPQPEAQSNRPRREATERFAPGAWIYRLYNDADELLYVGVSANLLERLRAHSHKANQWWPEVAWCAVERVGWMHDALRAERAAIRDEQPRYNRRSVPLAVG